LINFVSNLPHNLRTGGFAGINAAAFAAISKLEPVHYVGPINPPVVHWQSRLSKLLRVVGSQGTFSFFSQRRLAAIARDVHAKCLADARLDFFHGFTPWVLTRPGRPYFAHSDCTFRDYIDVYQRRDQFQPDDLQRIEQAEAQWLKNARRVLFTTDWAAKRATTHYRLDGSHVDVVGLYCEIEVPLRDVYEDSRHFVFMATNFEAKGGRAVLSAFRKVRKHHSDATLTVVGDRPSDVKGEHGVAFAGFLRKENSLEHARLRHILGQARAVVHPTTSDIGPLIIIEAGYFGCPVISSRRFAIPELIDDRRTGILLDDPSQVDELVSAMIWMIEHEDAYRQMRRAVWAKAHGAHSKARYEERMRSYLGEESSLHGRR
jgi:glycosyltransferase involved in cell wall biosynthesis